MSEIPNKYFANVSDAAILINIGAFIKQQRLIQNKSQEQLALDSGINRSTLIELEKGKGSTILTFIQVLRALNLHSMLSEFQEKITISPMMVAEAEMKKRKRASKSKGSKNYFDLDW